MVSNRWSFKTNPISRMTAEIFCVKHLAKHIPTENASPFLCFRGKIGGLAFFNFGLMSVAEAESRRVSH